MVYDKLLIVLFTVIYVPMIMWKHRLSRALLTIDFRGYEARQLSLHRCKSCAVL